MSGFLSDVGEAVSDGVAEEAAEIKDGYVGLIRAEKTLAGSLQNPNLTPDVRVFIQGKHNLINTYIKIIGNYSGRNTHLLRVS